MAIYLCERESRELEEIVKLVLLKKKLQRMNRG